MITISPNRPLVDSYFRRNQALRVADRPEVAGRPSYLLQVAALWAQSGRFSGLC